MREITLSSFSRCWDMTKQDQNSKCYHQREEQTTKNTNEYSCMYVFSDTILSNLENVYTPLRMYKEEAF